MTPNDLSAIGQYLHGERWKSPLSRDLQVSKRTVHRWADGSWDVPSGAASDLYTLAAARQAEDLAPVLADIAAQHGLPEVIELAVHQGNVESIHKRPWSNAADKRIKQALAALLTESGIPAMVVEK